MLLKRFLSALLFLSCCLVLPASTYAADVQADKAVAKGSYAGKHKVKAFAKAYAQAHGKPVGDIMAILIQGQRQDTILKAISRPAEKKLTWGEYRRIFIEPERISKGVIFWRENRALLDEVSRKYGVAPEIIVAIIGVETRYGRVTGSYRVLDALMTLAFDYPPRADFFRGQLEQYLLMCDEQHLDPAVLKGSYAGAMGYGQFMPSSYREYAVDYDRDGVADIWANPADAIASVANYFAGHGWKYGQLVALQLVPQTVDDALVATALEANQSVLSLRNANVLLPSQLDDDARVTFMKQVTDLGNEYWLGFDNFYAITRYNHSSMYALAAFQLSELLKAHLDMP